MKVPIALTIAGSDSGGGAGIQADLKTFQALGVYGCSALTAITAQNSRGVQQAQELPVALVVAQVDAVCSDLSVGAAKTGMLASAPVVAAVAEALARWQVPNLVVDPVIYAKDGTALLDAGGAQCLLHALLPLATVVTPNLPEAAALAGMDIATTDQAQEACRRLAAHGPRYVLLKGGHLTGDAQDLLFDGQEFIQLSYPRLPGKPVHGTGCTLSAAITALLARGLAPVAAVTQARAWLQRQIARAQVLGGGFRVFIPPAHD